MKISVAMVEAGIFALDNIQRTKQSAEAVVTAVFSAMDAVRAREDVKAPGAAPVYVHQEYPAMRYGPDGARQVFKRAEDVPEGWGDRPDFATAAKEAGADTVGDLVLIEARAAYLAKFGKAAHHKQSAEKIRALIAEAP